MRLSKERIVLLGVLGAGMLLLAVDKTLLGPSGAAASTPAPANAPAPTPTAAGSPAALAAAAAAPALADRLVAASGGPGWSLDLRTELSSAGEWLAPPEPPAGIAAGPDPGTAPLRPNPAAAFRARHRLTAIVSAHATAQAVAVIDGQPRHVGAAIDGFVLASIEPDSVTLEGDGLRVQLTLDRAGVTAPGRPE